MQDNIKNVIIPDLNFKVENLKLDLSEGSYGKIFYNEKIEIQETIKNKKEKIKIEIQIDIKSEEVIFKISSKQNDLFISRKNGDYNLIMTKISEKIIFFIKNEKKFPEIINCIKIIKNLPKDKKIEISRKNIRFEISNVKLTEDFSLSIISCNKKGNLQIKDLFLVDEKTNKKANVFCSRKIEEEIKVHILKRKVKEFEKMVNVNN